MIATLRLTTFVLAALTTLAAAQERPPMQPGNRDQMPRMSWLVGKWAGQGDMPGYGPNEFEHTYSWTLNKTFIKSESYMTVDGKVVWHDIGMIGWDAQNKAFSSFNFGIDGLIGYGAAESEKEGDLTEKTELVVRGRTTNGTVFRWVLRKVDDDTLESTCIVVEGDKETQAFKQVAKRVKAKAAKAAEAAEAAKAADAANAAKAVAPSDRRRTGSAKHPEQGLDVLAPRRTSGRRR